MPKFFKKGHIFVYFEIINVRKLRAIRRQKKLSLASVARLCGMHPSTLSNYELEKTTMPAKVLVRLLMLYQIDIAEITTEGMKQV